MAKIAFLECSKCGHQLSGDVSQSLCPKDAGVLYVRYDLAAIKKSFPRESLRDRVNSMWRYADVLPGTPAYSLGEGMTPMIPSRTTKNVWIKDEGVNPTGSFKARGLCMAVTMAKHYGFTKLAIPSAGNAASALAAYAAAAKMEAFIFMPKDVPMANLVECKAYGANVTLVDGLISDCGRMVGERKQAEGWFEICTLKEPFRVEGKKTMGYEIAEQLNWELPDAVFYPTGGGVGMIGMWKAFDEMEQLGWIGSKRPKMIAVQASGCAPIPKAFEEGKAASEMWPNASTFASGLRVPKAYGDYIVLDILHKSGGVAISVPDDEIMEAARHWSRVEGVFAAPEGAAALAAYRRLRDSCFFAPEDTVILFNTGTGLKYLDTLEGAEEPCGAQLPTSRQIAGIIGPY